MLFPAVAAGHPATAEAGAEILSEGGSAADAAVAACLASCVAETVMTGLLGGGHAIYFDAATGRIENLDCFVAVPGLGGARADARPMVELDVPFGDEVVRYSIGPSSCAVPGVPAGLDALWRRYGRLPWARVVEPALRLARAGVALPPMHAACLAMLGPVLTMDVGERIYSPGGRLLESGELLRQPGLVAALEAMAAEGAGTIYSGTLAVALLALLDERGGLVTRADLAAYRAVWSGPLETRRGEHRVATRGGLSGIVETLQRLPSLRGLGEAEQAVALVEALAGPELDGHTTNLVATDAEGSACVLTTSLGLGSGDFVPGYDLHLNSMLGEHDLVTGVLQPGVRMRSMMAPTLAFDRQGLVLAAGAAGGSRLRTALVGVVAAILDTGCHPQGAINRPRAHPVGAVVNAEPGVPEEALAVLEAAGRRVRRWPAMHHYFGGVSVIARSGTGADPRRNGAVVRAGFRREASWTGPSVGVVPRPPPSIRDWRIPIDFTEASKAHERATATRALEAAHDLDVQLDDGELSVFVTEPDSVETVQQAILRELEAAGVEHCVVRPLRALRWDEELVGYVDPAAPNEREPRLDVERVAWVAAVTPVSIWRYQDALAVLRARGFTIVSADGHTVDVAISDDIDATLAELATIECVSKVRPQRLSRFERWHLRQRLLGNYASPHSDPIPPL